MGEDAVSPLARALANTSALVRSNAACALQEIGPAARAAAPALILLLKDPDELVRERAIWALAEITPDPRHTTAPLVACLSDDNFNIRAAAASALGAIKPTTPDAVAGLIRALHDEDGDVQQAAATALGELGDDAVPAISGLIEMLKSRNAYRYGHPVVLYPVAETAAEALGTLGRRAEAAMPALLDLIREKERTFERFGPSDTCDNYRARRAATIAAARISPQSPELVRVLAQSLENDDWIRGEVAVALALIGPQAKHLVPLLMRFTEPDPRFANGLSCACAAVVIEPDNSLAVRTMLDLLLPQSGGFNDDHWSLLRTALTRASDRSRPAIPILIEIAKDSSADQENALRTLATFGAEAHSAIPAALELLATRWEHPRTEAIAALQQIASAKSVPLLAALKNRDANVRSGTGEVLSQFPEALALISEALDDPSARVRVAALQSLAKVGGNARTAIPRIRGFLQSDSRSEREAAAMALGKME